MGSFPSNAQIVQVSSHLKVSAISGGFTGVLGSDDFFGDLDHSDQFGCSVSTMGDLDNNGIDDLIVGSWRNDDRGQDKGAFWFLFLKNNLTTYNRPPFAHHK